MIEHKPLYEAMHNAISQTLENMAFTEARPHFDQNYEIPADDLVWTYLMLLDPIPGEIRLALPISALKELTAAVFSLDDEEITQAQMDDILNEILNTIAGLFMTNLLTDNQPFKIGLPVQGKGALPELDEDTISWKMMTSDESPLQVFVTGTGFVEIND